MADNEDIDGSDRNEAGCTQADNDGRKVELVWSGLGDIAIDVEGDDPGYGSERTDEER